MMTRPDVVELPRGVAVIVAEQLGVTAGAVRSVCRGKAISARISAAIASLALDFDRTPLPPALTQEQLRELAYGGRYYGLYSRAAKSSGLSRSTIADAAHGRTKSRLALDHLHAQMGMMSTAIVPPRITDRLSDAQRAAFQPGGRYYGSVTRVSRRLKTSPGNVSSTLNGRRSVPRILRALRNEMARIDGSIAKHSAAEVSK